MRSAQGIQINYFRKKIYRVSAKNVSYSELKKPKNLSFNDNSKTQIYSYRNFEAFKKIKYILDPGCRQKSEKGTNENSLDSHFFIFGPTLANDSLKFLS